MNVSGLISTKSRWAIVAAGMAVLLATSAPAQAQNAAAQQPAQADGFKFDYDGPIMILYNVKPDRTADFESAWAAIRAGLAKSTDAELKAFGETLYPYRIEGANIYIFRLDPPSKKFSYNPVKLLYDNVNNEKPENGLFTRAEADDIYKKISGAPVENGINVWKLKRAGAPTP